MIPPAWHSRGDRSGTTLSEVLISLLIMGIGVLSVATLFPIAVLRTVQATQLTNATILRKDVEQALAMYPQLVFDPDFHFANVPYNNFVGEPNGNLTYIIDPVGWNAPQLATQQATFGTIPRWHAGFETPALAKGIGYLPDSWIQKIRVTPTATSTVVNAGPTIGTTTITLPANTGADLQALDDGTTGSVRSGVPARLVLLSPDRRKAATRILSPGDISYTTQTIVMTGNPLGMDMWVDANNNGAPDTGEFPIGEVRIEEYSQRYSWLLTVRKTSTEPLKASVEMVVFFNRKLSTDAETIWTLQNPGFQKGVSPAKVTFATIPPIGGGTRPFLKKGGYLFDAVNGYWYRITKIDNAEGQTPTVTLDQPARAGTPNDAVPATQCLAMPTVVEVYSLYDQILNCYPQVETGQLQPISKCNCPLQTQRFDQ